MLSFLFRGACPFGLPSPHAPHDSAGSGARFRQVGHDSVTAAKVPHFPAESCPTSQRNPAPLQTESVPHFDRNPQAYFFLRFLAKCRRSFFFNCSSSFSSSITDTGRS